MMKKAKFRLLTYCKKQFYFSREPTVQRRIVLLSGVKAAFVLCDVKAVAKLEHQRLLVLKIYRTYLNCTNLKKNFIQDPCKKSVLVCIFD